MVGQIPMIVECSDWTVQLPNSATTIFNITTNVVQNNYTTNTYIDNTTTHHHYNVTNVTRMVNETVTQVNVVEKAVNTTVSEKVWGVSEAAFFWGTALAFFALIAIAYFIYATITSNKREELKANAMGTEYGKLKEKPRRNRIF